MTFIEEDSQPIAKQQAESLENKHPKKKKKRKKENKHPDLTFLLWSFTGKIMDTLSNILQFHLHILKALIFW